MPPRRTGFTLIELLVVMAIVSVLTGLILSAVQRVRASAERARCANQLRQIGLALHQFHQTQGRFPAGTSGPTDAMPFAAWPARLLPFLEQNAVWGEIESAFRLEKDFLKVPPHRWLAEPMPPFACPADSRAAVPGILSSGSARGLTSYLGIEGINSFRRDGLLFLDSAVRMADIGDGASHTLMVGERPPSSTFVLGWWYGGWGMDQTGSGDAVLGVRAKNNGEYGPDCPTGPYRFLPGRVEDPCAAFHFWSLHNGGAHFLLADPTHTNKNYAADDLLPALATRSGGDIADGMPDEKRTR
jgi:prepilin-type N-terminal cleavage/methylation domain-containing protein